MKPLLFRVVKRKLQAAGFVQVSQRGSHVKFKKATPSRTFVTVVPHHPDVSAGTIRSILNQAGLTPEEFNAL